MVAEDTGTFHESWYRIADQRISLRPGVRVRRQMFRGERWYVLFDPFNNQFFRLRPAAYDFVARLTMNRTVEEVWRGTMERDPDNAPGQEDVIRLLSQLYHANLLHYRISADSEQLFERHRKRKQRILHSTLLNLMFIRIPLFDPHDFVKRLLPFVGWLIGPAGVVLWLAMAAGALKLVAENFEEIRLQSEGILAPSNLFLLYAGLVIVKTLHEFGHAFVCERLGGEVHTMGVMFLIFSPLPFMDATSSWAFRSKWRRALVAGSGMLVEVFVAGIAVFVWANTGPGTLHSLAYNMLFVASVSTVVFNVNPLLRYDGYYILSDLLDIPNLHNQARLQLVHVVERYAFGIRKSESPAKTLSEAGWLTFFGIASGIYKIVVFGGILLFVADRFLLAGIVMAVICAIGWVVAPLVRFVKYLVASPRLERSRLRAAAVSAGVVAAAGLFLYFCPFPNSFKAPGVLEAADREIVINRVAGSAEEVIALPGRLVCAGEPLVRLANRELEIETTLAEYKLEETRAARRKAERESPADIKPLDGKIGTIEKNLARLAGEREKLVVRSAVRGAWIAPDIRDMIGRWIPRGTPLGQVVDNGSLKFSAVVSQDDASRLFSREIVSCEVKLAGQAAIRIPVTGYDVVPAEQTRLPSASLGWMAGGDLAVDTKDPQGTRTAEPYYKVLADLGGRGDAVAFHGRAGRIRFKLAAEPLFRQAWRRLRQIIQKRYRI